MIRVNSSPLINHPWYKVQFNWYQVTLYDLTSWCDNHPSKGRYTVRYHELLSHPSAIAFEFEEDAMMFKLRWS